MSKWINSAALDAALNYVRANCNLMVACSAQPTTYTEAITTYALASVALTVNTDYTLADNSPDGRKITVAAKNRVAISGAGTITHIALVNTGDSSLRLVTTCNSQVVTAGSDVDFPTWAIAINGPFLPDGNGPLRVSSVNPRYFTDNTGKAIYLTGSQTWYSIVNGDYSDPPAIFDFDAYLTWLESWGHNFFKTFAWQHTYQDNETEAAWYNDPLPFTRPGPGNAGDGKPKYDLTTLNQTYFDNLRAKVIKAGQRGIYVSVQMWYGMDFDNKAPWGLHNIWAYHPFNVANNINGINADPASKGEGEDFATLNTSAVTAVQEAYVRKVIDTVNDLDNVIYEICNEPPGGQLTGGAYTRDWQYHFVDYIHTYEADKPKQHPVGMTVAWPNGSNTDCDNSNAEWVSYNGDVNSPPLGTGNKVVLHDTDHLCGVCGDRFWAWKSFCNGLNPTFMDPYDCVSGHAQYNTSNNCVSSNFDDPRKSMGYTLDYAKRMDLINMTPDNAICSTGYCLKKTNAEYLCYQPATNGAAFTLNLSAASGTFNIEWFRPSTGATTSGGTTTGGATRTLTPPASIDYVAYLYK